MAIRSSLSEKSDLFGVFGFGSFFRGSEYNDIDLLLVSTPDARYPLRVYQNARLSLKELSLKYRVEFDITFLTYSEHQAKPLREHQSLVEIWQKQI